jgi:hypothetical protein
MNTTLQLSDQGADRASAYHMSTKFAFDGHSLWVTWLANPYQVRLSQVCPRTWRVLAEVPLVQGYDNHCGASLVMQDAGRLHVIAGAHHQAFIHRFSSSPADPHAWSLPHAVGKLATYPSTAIDPENRYLHLAYRSSSDPWTLVYQRAELSADPPVWSKGIRTLLRAPSKGYCYWTNSLAITPDGTLHLLAEFYKQHISPAGFSPAVTHVYSPDHGATWHHTDNRPLDTMPSGLEQVTPIVFRGGGDVRPSGMIACRDGALAFTMIDRQTQQLLLARKCAGESWQINDWTAALRAHMPADYTFCSHASLAQDRQGDLHGCVVIAPEDGFGHPQSQLLHLRVQRGQDSPVQVRLLPPWREGHPDWLASMHPAPPQAGQGKCLLLHQSGNRGEGCINDATTQVVLRVLG